jgi:hypothetical protein
LTTTGIMVVVNGMLSMNIDTIAHTHVSRNTAKASCVLPYGSGGGGGMERTNSEGENRS